MEEWWLLDRSKMKVDDDGHCAKPLARHNRQVAYFNTLFAGTEARLVLNDIREMCYSSGNIELISLYAMICNIAGRTRETELAAIAAEAKAIEFQSVEEITEGDHINAGNN